MDNTTMKGNPAEKIVFSEAEMKCLNAATAAIRSVSEKLSVYDLRTEGPGIPRAYGTYSRQLLIDIVHDKYDECVAASAPSLPQKAEVKSLQ